jgi:hypothetical protein
LQGHYVYDGKLEIKLDSTPRISYRSLIDQWIFSSNQFINMSLDSALQRELKLELKDEIDIVIENMVDSAAFLKGLFEYDVTKQERVITVAKEVIVCNLEVYKRLKRVSRNDSQPPVYLIERMLSGLFDDTKLVLPNERKLKFLQFLQWFYRKGIQLALHVSSISGVEQMQDELKLLREVVKNLKDCKAKHRDSFKSDQITPVSRDVQEVTDEGKRKRDDLADDLVMEKKELVFGNSIIRRDLSKEEIHDIASGKLTKDDEIWINGIITSLKGTWEYQEVQNASITDLKKWYVRLDETYTSDLRIKGSRIAASWVLKMFVMGGYKDVKEHVMESFLNDNAEVIVKAAITGLLLEDRRFKWL